MEGLLLAVLLLGITTVAWLVFRRKHKEKPDPNQGAAKRKDEIAIHDILQDKNGNGVGEKNGFHNPSYIKEDDLFTQQGPTSREELGRPRQSRQVSDISELFRMPNYGDDKSLSELVFEELEKSKSVESLDRLSHDDNEPNCDVTAESRSRASTPECDVTIEVPKSTEWRDKLRAEMENDDLEFIDESSDDDILDRVDDVTKNVIHEDPESETENREHSPANDDVTAPPPSVDDVMRGAAPTLSTVTSQDKAATSLDRPIVIDNGSCNFRVGFAGEFKPSSVIRNVVGSWRAGASEAWSEALGTKFIGQEAITRHATLTLENPVQDGRVSNWRKMQEVWDHVIAGELETDMTSHPVIVTESIGADKKQREKMIEVLIETIRCPAATLRHQAAMCSLTANRQGAIVVSSGHGLTEVVPVYEGYTLEYGVQQLPVGGRHVTEYLARLAQRERGSTFTSVPELEIVNNIKEKCARVTLDGKPSSDSEEHEITLPDGQVIVLDKELTGCVEPIFSPSLVGSASLGLPQLIKKSIENIDPDVLTASGNQILLAGGNSKLAGMEARLRSEVKEMVGDLGVQLSECGDNAAWVGASLLAGQSNFPSLCITEDVYFERGASVVHRICF